MAERSGAKHGSGGRCGGADHVLGLRDAHKACVIGSAAVERLRGVERDANRGDVVPVTGASGSGQPILINLPGLLDAPGRGSCPLDGP